MIHIEPKEPSGPKLDKWEKKAREETRKLVENAQKGESLDFKSNIWGELKSFLEKRFHKKCAYCEGNYSAGSYLDVEHYRPKKKVTVDSKPGNTGKIKDAEGNEKDHPGYYWLAYDWRNLLLSCEKCNRGSGKMNQFPIKGKRAYCPEDPLEEEEPLLLNPYEEGKLEDHFSIPGFDGFIKGETDEGKETIKICDLNREALRERRQEALENTLIRYLVKKANDPLSKKAGGDAEMKITDDMQYSAYLKKGLVRYLENEAKELKDKHWGNRRERALHRCAREVEQDEALNKEMEDWDVTAGDGIDSETW